MSKVTEITCLNCGWVHFALTEEQAQEQVDNFNKWYDAQDEATHALYKNEGASIGNYVGCRLCHTNSFRLAEEGDCPIGCTLSPVIWEDKANDS